MRIIDFHTHPTYLGGLLKTEEDFIKGLRAAGIAAAAGSALDILLMAGADTLDAMRRLNERIFSFRDKHPDYIIPGIHVSSNYVGESISEIDKYLKKGLKLVGELVPHYLGGRVLDDPLAYGAGSFLELGFFEIFKICEEKELVLSLHTSTADEVKKIAESFPSLKIVMAHFGPETVISERVLAALECDNLFIDISGSGTLSPGAFEYAYQTLGKEKILFGTDYPIYAPEAFVDVVLKSDISDDSKEYIFHKNAENLLNI